MFDGTPYRDELRLRLTTIRRILDAADPLPAEPSGEEKPSDSALSAVSEKEGIGREARGLVIVLLYASYENLLKSLCRGLLERAVHTRVGNKRLRRGFRQFAVHNLFQSIVDSGKKEIWNGGGAKLLDCAFDSQKCTINTNIFPDDGSFMKSSQVRLFFEIFSLGDPGPILKEVWDKIDGIVTARNNIAHGQMVPEDIGRSYSSVDIRELVKVWEERWIDVINYVEAAASVREFYRY